MKKILFLPSFLSFISIANCLVAKAQTRPVHLIKGDWGELILDRSCHSYRCT